MDTGEALRIRTRNLKTFTTAESIIARKDYLFSERNLNIITNLFSVPVNFDSELIYSKPNVFLAYCKRINLH